MAPRRSAVTASPPRAPPWECGSQPHDRAGGAATRRRRSCSRTQGGTRCAGDRGDRLRGRPPALQLARWSSALDTTTREPAGCTARDGQVLLDQAAPLRSRTVGIDAMHRCYGGATINGTGISFSFFVCAPETVGTCLLGSCWAAPQSLSVSRCAEPSPHSPRVPRAQTIKCRARGIQRRRSSPLHWTPSALRPTRRWHPPRNRRRCRLSRKHRPYRTVSPTIPPAIPPTPDNAEAPPEPPATVTSSSPSPPAPPLEPDDGRDSRPSHGIRSRAGKTRGDTGNTANDNSTILPLTPSQPLHRPSSGTGIGTAPATRECRRFRRLRPGRRRSS